MTEFEPERRSSERPVRRRSTTRARLIEAAGAIFDESGTTAISVEALVARAGFTRGAFYSNFASVDEVFFAVYAQQAAAVFDLLSDALSAVRRAEKPTMHEVVSAVVHGLPPEEKWYAIRSVLITRARHDPAVGELLRAHSDQFHDTLQPLLLDALTRIGRAPSVEPGLFTRAVVAAHIGAVGQSAIYDETDRVRITAVGGCVLGLTRAAPPAEN